MLSRMCSHIGAVTSCLGGGSVLGDSKHLVWRPRGSRGLPAGDQEVSGGFSWSGFRRESLSFVVGSVSVWLAPVMWVLLSAPPSFYVTW